MRTTMNSAGLTGAMPISQSNCPTSRRSEEHTSELQSQSNLVCRLLLETKKTHLSLSPRAPNVGCCDAWFGVLPATPPRQVEACAAGSDYRTTPSTPTPPRDHPAATTRA